MCVKKPLQPWFSLVTSLVLSRLHHDNATLASIPYIFFGDFSQ